MGTRRGGSKSTHNLCFEQDYKKYQNFLSENFPFWVVKFSIHSNRRVFVMSMKMVGVVALKLRRCSVALVYSSLQF